MTARLVRMDWIFVLQDKDTIRGTIDRTILLPPGKPHDIPIVMRLDLLDFFANNRRGEAEQCVEIHGVHFAHEAEDVADLVHDDRFEIHSIYSVGLFSRHRRRRCGSALARTDSPWSPGTSQA